MTVAASKHQGVVQLEKIRHPHCLPASHEAGCDLPVLLAPLGLDIDLMGGQVHYVERVKPAIAFDVTWTQKIGLMNVVAT